jgi:hypothetical protein
MKKKILALTVLLLLVAGCTPEATNESADSPAAESTTESALNPIEENMEESNEPDGEEAEGTNPDVTTVPPSGSVDLGQLTPDAGTEDGDLIVQPAPGIPDPEAQMVQLAGEALAERLGIDIGEVTLVEAVSMEWPDAGLGCPSPDFMYAAVITPGYQITLEAQGQSYTYHTDTVENAVLCVDGQPAE